MAYTEYETKRNYVSIAASDLVKWNIELRKWFNEYLNKYPSCKILNIIQHGKFTVTIIFEYKVEVKDNNKSNRP